jgi:hypothetical protein
VNGSKVLTEKANASRVIPPRPYEELQRRAEKLSEDLEQEAIRCEFRPERERLRLLSAVFLKAAGCLSGLGVR